MKGVRPKLRFKTNSQPDTKDNSDLHHVGCCVRLKVASLFLFRSVFEGPVVACAVSMRSQEVRQEKKRTTSSGAQCSFTTPKMYKRGKVGTALDDFDMCVIITVDRLYGNAIVAQCTEAGKAN
jgi:hypothetical protein